ncbi:MAG TPA: lysylphosphatidylglycerol synthase transmembrane domain-containing protein, partial [Candidatus Omnitrophota bacterium]|nr:lysylphosphatidylglycerol synthase transmembrane domain-containing protein [Candidatus Omnitrophota bacterium]
MVRVKKVISLLARLSVSCLLLVLLFKFNKIDLAVLTNDIKGADKWLLAVGFLFSIFSCILGFLRWKMLLAGAGIKASLKKLISTFSGGIFFSIFLPSTIGGDLVRVADLAQHTQKAKEVVATVFLDRLSGYIGLVLVIFPALLLGGDLISDKVVFSSVSTIILLLAVILLVLFNNSIYSRITKFFSTPGSGKIKETLKNIHREIHVFRHQKRMIVSNLLISFIIQLTLPISV